MTMQSPAASFPEPGLPAPDVALRPTLPRVVAIGGGTGLPNVLRGLRPLLYGEAGSTPRDQLVAVVTTTDDGGSSGRLREQLGMIPPGDIRNCLAALAEQRGLVAELFQYRFDSGDGLNGHALGNLVLAALADVTRDFERAVELAGRVVGAHGTVLPATTESVTLVADLEDGRTLQGETAIAGASGRIHRLSLAPRRPRCPESAIAAVMDADAIVVGPGSLYTSVLPPLLVPELADAIARARGARIFVMNLMTEPGETDGYSAAEHLDVVLRHVGVPLFDVVLYSTSTISQELTDRYNVRGSSPVLVNATQVDALTRAGVQTIGVPMASELVPGRIRHQPERLGAAIAAIAMGRLGAGHGRAPVPDAGSEA